MSGALKLIFVFIVSRMSQVLELNLDSLLVPKKSLFVEGCQILQLEVL